MTLDAKRGIVYVPTGSAAFDFYGADRVGDDLFANCLIALNAQTGERIWHFQEVRHDIWDRDFPAAPVLLTVKRDGKDVDAVAQTTKQGFVYLFDRTNGKLRFSRSSITNIRRAQCPAKLRLPNSLFRLCLRPSLASSSPRIFLPTERPKSTSGRWKSFASSEVTGQFVPFSVGTDTVVFPGFDGGAEWGGPAVDPETGIIYVNANDVAWTGALAPNTGENSAQGIYLSQCGVCHGEKMMGSPPAIPSLVGVGDRLAPQQIASTIKSGKGRMPGFPNLSDDQMFALVIVSHEWREQRTYQQRVACRNR